MGEMEEMLVVVVRSGDGGGRGNMVVDMWRK